MNKVFIFILFLAVKNLAAQHAQVYPTNWWTGMKWNKVQLLIRGENSLADEKIRISYPGLSVTKIHRLENPKYIAVDITISPSAKPGNVKIEFEGGAEKGTVSWQLKTKRKGNGETFAQG